MDGWWYNRFVKAFVILGFGFLLVKYYCGGGRYMKTKKMIPDMTGTFHHVIIITSFPSRFICIYLTLSAMWIIWFGYCSGWERHKR